MSYNAISRYRTPAALRAYLQQAGIELDLDDEVEQGPEAPLSKPYRLSDGFLIGNRACTHPMEGWDGTPDGRPTDLTIRRWANFGRSGAKLIWGGEAVAVCHAGRANPNQLCLKPENLGDFVQLRQTLVDHHRQAYGRTDDLLIGLQLTHSGRFAQPNVKGKAEPVILYHHPFLDPRVGIGPDYPLMTDGEIGGLIAQFVTAAGLAQQAGFDFVDIKHCHGYLGHEFLSAVTRSGPYGGSFENRTRFLREVVDGIRGACPGLRMGVRLSAFDFPQFKPDPLTGIGRPVAESGYPFLFGAAPGRPLEVDLGEAREFLALLKTLGIEMVNITGGSPYYNPHIQRPTRTPTVDGYQPPEDPLVGVARHVQACAILKSACPDMLIVGTGYTYLQEYLGHVAQANIRAGRVDFVGVGRMLLSYPDYFGDLLSGKLPDRRRLCRTFSDCTNGPRMGLVSGCYPLDPVYKEMPEFEELERRKEQLAQSRK